MRLKDQNEKNYIEKLQFDEERIKIIEDQRMRNLQQKEAIKQEIVNKKSELYAINRIGAIGRKQAKIENDNKHKEDLNFMRDMNRNKHDYVR